MASLPNVNAAPTDLSSILGLMGNSNLMGSLFGTKDSGTEDTTSKSVSTNKIDQVGLNSMLADLLGSNLGLAQLLGGQKSAGLYNSSTNTLLANDFVSRMLGQVAQRNSTETKTGTTAGKTTKTRAPQVDPGKAMMAAMAKNLLGGLGGKKGKAGQVAAGTQGEIPQIASSDILSSSAGGFDQSSIAGGDNYGYDSGAGMEYAGLDYNWGWESATPQDTWFADNGFAGSDYNFIDDNPFGGMDFLSDDASSMGDFGGFGGSLIDSTDYSYVDSGGSDSGSGGGGWGSSGGDDDSGGWIDWGGWGGGGDSGSEDSGGDNSGWFF